VFPSLAKRVRGDFKMKIGYGHYLLLIVAATALLMGCAAIPTKEADLKESLRSSAAEYWEMRMKDRYEDSYKMEERSGLPSYAEYMNKAMMIKKATITSFSVMDVHIEGDKGVVDVGFSFVMPPVTKPFKQVIKDEWVYKDQRWWHRFK